MPFIVTTRHSEVPRNFPPRCRRAVAALGDAQAYVSGWISGALPWPTNPEATRAAADQLWSLPESGGTVGPLPDGTLIEVELVEWRELSDRAGTSIGPAIPTRKARILDAFNAREATR